MNNGRIDLNLLQIFRAVMEERNVSRAADRLAMTQPAVSNALNRLRHLLDDPLFTRVSGGVKPTQRALDIWPSIHAGLDTLGETLFPDAFTPGSCTTTFRVSITDSLTPIVSSLALRFAEAAPHAQLQFHHHSNLNSTRELISGDLDCAVGMFPRPAPQLHALGIILDDYVCVMRRAHPLAQAPLTASRFAAARHVLMKPSGAGEGAVDHWLRFNGYSRTVSVVVTHFAEAIEIAAATDLITCLPRRFVDAVQLERLDLAIMPLPFETERILYKLAWHDRADRVPEQVWLRNTIAEMLKIAYPTN